MKVIVFFLIIRTILLNTVIHIYTHTLPLSKHYYINSIHIDFQTLNHFRVTEILYDLYDQKNAKMLQKYFYHKNKILSWEQ